MRKHRNLTVKKKEYARLQDSNKNSDRVDTDLSGK